MALAYSGVIVGAGLSSGQDLLQYFISSGIPSWAGSLLCAVLIVLVAFLDFHRITAVLGIFTPLIGVMIFLATCYCLMQGPFDFWPLDVIRTNHSQSDAERCAVRYKLFLNLPSDRGLYGICAGRFYSKNRRLCQGLCVGLCLQFRRLPQADWLDVSGAWLYGHIADDSLVFTEKDIRIYQKLADISAADANGISQDVSPLAKKIVENRDTPLQYVDEALPFNHEIT